MHLRLNILVALMLVACATPYQKMGFRGGFRDRQLAPERYFIEVKVNGFTSAGTAMEYLHRRASELCPYGFDLVDRQNSSSKHYSSTVYGVQEVKKPRASAVIECSQPTQRSPRPSPPARTEPVTMSARVQSQYDETKNRTTVRYDARLSDTASLIAFYRYEGRALPDERPDVFLQFTFRRPAWTFRDDHVVTIVSHEERLVPEDVHWDGEVTDDGVKELVMLVVRDDLRLALRGAQLVRFVVGHADFELTGTALGKLKSFVSFDLTDE